MRACYSHKSKSIEFGGMIGYYPGTIWLDFGIDRVKGHEKVKIFFESHEIWWDDWLLSRDHLIRFWHDRVKGQGHEKVNILFLP